MAQQNCMRCGSVEAAVIDNEATLCGNCFLDEALRRRRRLSPAPRWRARREKLAPIAALSAIAVPSYHRRA